MENIFNVMFDLSLSNTGYKNHDEYISNEIQVVNLMLVYYLNRFSSENYSEIRKNALADLQKARDYVKHRVEITDENMFLAGVYFKQIYDFNDMEWFFFVAALAFKFDPRIKKKFLKIDNDKVLTYPSVFRLYFFVEEIGGIKNYSEMYFSLSKKLNLFCFNDEIVRIDNRVFENIMSNGKKKMDISGLSVIYPQKKGMLLIRENLAKKLELFFKNKPANSTAFCCICGQHGMGKTSLMARVCEILKKCVVCIDVSCISSENMTKSLLSACREASFLDGFICLKGFERITDADILGGNYIQKTFDDVKKFTDGVFVFFDEEDHLPEFIRDGHSIIIKLEDLSNEESFKLWKQELKSVNLSDNVNIHDMSNKFKLTPLQIKRAKFYAVLEQSCSDGKPITSEKLSDAAYAQITQKLSSQATVIKKKHKWDELVLPEAQKNALARACNQVKYKHVVYDKWGLKNTILYGTGLSMLFAGPPGTGKTMAAQVVANELNLEIYRVDLSRIVSKYIGETEKNLAAVFDGAKKSNVILLFDETDALFGKRTEVKDSHDKHANLETAYILQKMEEYDGITIMTTNLMENLDTAFFRRISYVIHFPLPDMNSRKMIWQKMYPKSAPLSKNVDFDFLSKRFEFSGGNIKNIVITSTFMAASESKNIEMKHILKAIEYETKKQGKMISKSDFGEYAHLI